MSLHPDAASPAYVPGIPGVEGSTGWNYRVVYPNADPEIFADVRPLDALIPLLLTSRGAFPFSGLVMDIDLDDGAGTRRFLSGKGTLLNPATAISVRYHESGLYGPLADLPDDDGDQDDGPDDEPGEPGPAPPAPISLGSIRRTR